MPQPPAKPRPKQANPSCMPAAAAGRPSEPADAPAVAAALAASEPKPPTPPPTAPCSLPTTAMLWPRAPRCRRRLPCRRRGRRPCRRRGRPGAAETAALASAPPLRPRSRAVYSSSSVGGLDTCHTEVMSTRVAVQNRPSNTLRASAADARSDGCNNRTSTRGSLSTSAPR
jgi:hypothetical protein